MSILFTAIGNYDRAMTQTKRSGRYNPDTSTSLIVRTNLRKLREMRNLTRDQTVQKLEAPHLTSAMLAKIENGERAISVEELVQLSVAYQVPVQAIITPWTNDPLLQNQPLSGGATQAPIEAVQGWLLRGKYPVQADDIVPRSSSLEGAVNAHIFTDPEKLKILSSAPDLATYSKMVHQTVPLILQELDNGIERFKNDVEHWLKFDPFRIAASFISPAQSSGFQRLLRDELTNVEKWEITSYQIRRFDMRWLNLNHYADEIISGYFSNLDFAIVKGLDRHREYAQQMKSILAIYPTVNEEIVREAQNRSHQD